MRSCVFCLLTTLVLLYVEFDNTFSQMFPCRDSGGEFLPFLLVSKGKRLLARLLPFLKQDTALRILSIVTCNLPTLMSRDTEEVGEIFFSPPVLKSNLPLFYICNKTVSKVIFRFSSVWKYVTLLSLDNLSTHISQKTKNKSFCVKQ